MVNHHSGMENLTVFVYDRDPVSLMVITNMLENLGFEVFPFRTELTALDFLKRVTAKEVALNLILAEVHVSNMTSYTLAIFKLLKQIMSEQHVPFVSMCCNDDEEAISECMAIGACFHLPKPLTTGSFNMLRHTARDHKSKRATPVGRNIFNGTTSSSTKISKEVLNLGVQVPIHNTCSRCSSRWQPYEQSVGSMDTAKDKDSFREGKRTAGGIGYGARSPFESYGSNNMLTSFLGQTKKNNLTKTAGNNDNVQNTTTIGSSDGWLYLQGNNALFNSTNKCSSAQMYLTGPANDWEEMNSFWMTHMNGTQEQRNVRPYDLLQVDEACNEVPVWGNQPVTQEATAGETPVTVMQFAQTREATDGDAPMSNPVMQFAHTQEVVVGDVPVFDPVMQFTLSGEDANGDAPLSNPVMQFAHNEEATVGDAPVSDPVMQFAQTQEVDVGDALIFDPMMQFTQSLEDAVEDVPLFNPVIQFAQTQEATVGDAPVPNLVMQIAQTQQAIVGGAPVLDHVIQSAQEDIFWSFSPSVGDFDMLFPDSEST